MQRNVDFEINDVVYKHSHDNREFLHAELISYVNLFEDPSETLHYGQEYTISLMFDLPESDVNFDIGKPRLKLI